MVVAISWMFCPKMLHEQKPVKMYKTFFCGLEQTMNIYLYKPQDWNGVCFLNNGFEFVVFVSGYVQYSFFPLWWYSDNEQKVEKIVQNLHREMQSLHPVDKFHLVTAPRNSVCVFQIIVNS